MEQWQPIEIEGPPDENEYVWLGKPGFSRLGYFHGGYFMNVDGSPLSFEPTHWARLVAPEWPNA